MVHIYCGDGKGKTTAAIGMAVRAAGAGMRVVFIQFMKNGSSSEMKALGGIEGIEVHDSGDTAVFYKYMSEEDKIRAAKRHEELMSEAEQAVDSGRARVVILDEIINAVRLGLIDCKRVYRFMDSFPEEDELVLTGREPDEELLGRADYISEIRKVRHPYDAGIRARRGIEY